MIGKIAKPDLLNENIKSSAIAIKVIYLLGGKKTDDFLYLCEGKKVLRMMKECKIEYPWLSEVLDLRTLLKISLAHGSLTPDNRLRIQIVRHSLSMPGYNAFCFSLN